ncbi:siphovirus Gp157 family protein [Pseudomonas sp. TNT2022 ID357]|uniref:Siphovirus Gp157 family protein n=1 Tax=Pseudomonas idahonensis TaxID=2942628 RepID=A0ABT5Q6F1_9PSED|nr:siphovirus Gp157 family protein [Pseudomonas idahonensis]MDD1149779.1 siphovirus Gp157 family protein [Pseudomonas idahonensis]
MTELYALTGQMAELAALADNDDEGLRQAIQDTMDGIKGEFEVKADSIVMLRRNIEGDIDAIDKEVDRLNELKRIKKNTVDQISDYLRRNMEAADIKSIKRPLFTITLALSPEKVIVDDEKAVPDEFVSLKSVITPDKKTIAVRLKEIRDHNEAVRKRMAAGEDAEAELLEEPSWAHLERGESSIRIK